MPKDPYGPKAKPTPLARPAVTDPRHDYDDEETKVRCPICQTGLVPAEVAALIARLLEAAGENE